MTDGDFADLVTRW